MASWLFGVSKLKTDQIVENCNDNPSIVPTATNAEPVTDLPAMPNLSYDIKPAKPITSDPELKQCNMLDNIPFVLNSAFCTNSNSTNSLTNNLEDAKKCLQSVKNLLDSGALDYDFSKDRKLLNNTLMYTK